jgi:hypothetical protein
MTDEDTWKRNLDDEPDEVFDVDGDDQDEEIVERRAVCVFDFTAECDGEISIEIGQVVWVEFRKGVSGWLVVRDEITGITLVDGLTVESKGLVPEGYVRFLNDEEERQYLSQSPPTNTLLPQGSSGEETPRQPRSSQSKQRDPMSPGADVSVEISPSEPPPTSNGK